MIPDDVNVLITHGPPSGILDLNDDDEYCGCVNLLHRIKELTKLKCHVFGHIHNEYGTKEKYGIKFVNASLHYSERQPIVFDI